MTKKLLISLLFLFLIAGFACKKKDEPQKPATPQQNTEVNTDTQKTDQPSDQTTPTNNEQNKVDSTTTPESTETDDSTAKTLRNIQLKTHAATFENDLLKYVPESTIFLAASTTKFDYADPEFQKLLQHSMKLSKSIVKFFETALEKDSELDPVIFNALKQLFTQLMDISNHDQIGLDPNKSTDFVFYMTKGLPVLKIQPQDCEKFLATFTNTLKDIKQKTSSKQLNQNWLLLPSNEEKSETNNIQIAASCAQSNTLTLTLINTKTQDEDLNNLTDFASTPLTMEQIKAIAPLENPSFIFYLDNVALVSQLSDTKSELLTSIANFTQTDKITTPIISTCKSDTLKLTSLFPKLVASNEIATSNAVIKSSVRLTLLVSDQEDIKRLTSLTFPIPNINQNIDDFANLSVSLNIPEALNFLEYFTMKLSNMAFKCPEFKNLSKLKKAYKDLQATIPPIVLSLKSFSAVLNNMNINSLKSSKAVLKNIRMKMALNAQNPQLLIDYISANVLPGLNIEKNKVTPVEQLKAENINASMLYNDESIYLSTEPDLEELSKQGNIPTTDIIRLHMGTKLMTQILNNTLDDQESDEFKNMMEIFNFYKSTSFQYALGFSNQGLYFDTEVMINTDNF